MKKLIKSGLLVAGVSLMFTVPAFAETSTGHSMTGAGMTGTGTGVGTYSGTTTYNAPGAVRNYTNGVLTNGYTATDGYTNNGITTNTGRYGVNNYTGYRTGYDGRYRTTAATTNRNYNWGWLGLLGLIGLAGMRSRNPERNK